MKYPKFKLLTGLSLLALGTLAQASEPLEIHYTSAAAFTALRTSQEALPIGNGKLAAMIYGGVGTEHLQFNDDTVWAGAPNDYTHPGAAGWLQAIRDRVWQGEGEKAWTEAAQNNFMSIPIRQSPYVGTGILRFDTGHSGATGYRRSLDLNTATAVVEYTAGGVQYRRETFASFPDQVIVVRFTASEAGKISFTASYDSPHTARTVTSVGNDFILDGKVNQDANTRRQQTSAIEFQARARFTVEGGSSSASGSNFTVTGADAVTVVLSLASNFLRFDDVSADPEARTLAIIGAVAEKDYTQLRTTHLEDYQPLFQRVELDLGTSEAATLPTNERLARINTKLSAVSNAQKAQDVAAFTTGFDFDDPQLISLNFQMARYLLIAGSRPGSQPLTLQGKWNNELDPSWESKMTLNINQEMNYWLAEVAALPETHLPMVDLVKDLSISGARAAEVHYGADGWMVHHNTDLWRGTAPINNPGGLWPTGNAWLSMHIWWHYEYSRDLEYLEEIYPLLKGAVEFHEDFLVMDPRSPTDSYPAWGGTGHPQWGKYLLTNPSHSPEQPNKTLRDDGEIIAGPTIDNQLLRGLFSYFIEASETLDRDPALRQKATEMRDLLPPNMIGKHGQLQEWLEDVDLPENPAIGGHRHLSHLIDLFPGDGIHPLYEPELAAAAKVSLDWKGDLSNNTSWGRAWKMNLRTALLAGDHAFMILSDVIARSHTANMVFSNKGNGEDQIDGNMGVAMGTAQFFLQSRRGEIHLLPALPTKLATGSLKGFRAKDGFTVDLNWADGELVTGTVHSAAGRTARVRSATPFSVTMNGQPVTVATLQDGLYEFNTETGQVYELVAGDAPPILDWAGFPIDVNGWADTGDWLGPVNVGLEPWVLLGAHERWLFAPADGVDTDGGWFYFFK